MFWPLRQSDTEINSAQALLGDLSDQYGLSHLLFCMIIIGAHSPMFQEREQFLFVPPETLDQSLNILVSVGCCQKLFKTAVQSGFQVIILISSHKQDAKNLFDRWRAPTFGDQIAAELPGGKAP